jgi:hypothetical protein
MAWTRERNRMTTLFCAHCRSDFPSGASVCNECQAEAHYGVPRRIYLRVVGASLVTGAVLGSATSSSVVFCVASALVLIGGVFWAKRRFRDHVQFLRRSRKR